MVNTKIKLGYFGGYVMYKEISPCGTIFRAVSISDEKPDLISCMKARLKLLILEENMVETP